MPPRTFFDSSKVDALLSKRDDSSMNYIILMNNELHQKYQKSISEKNEMERTNDTLEHDVDCLSKSRTALQGYIKNEIEYAKCWMENCRVYKTLYNNALAHICIQVGLQLFIIMLLSNLSSSYHHVVLLIYIPLLLIGSTHTLRAMCMRAQILTEANRKTIAKVEKANIYVMDLIDNI